MTKIKRLKQKIIFTLCYLLVVAVFYFLKIPCIYRAIFNIECPGCGITRALISTFKFDFISAFAYNSMFWSIPVIYLYFLFDGNLFKNKLVNRAVIILIGIGFLINWVYSLLTK